MCQILLYKFLLLEAATGTNINAQSDDGENAFVKATVR